MPNPFFENPRTRRLRRDLADMRALAEQSSIMSFKANGDAPAEYVIQFDGKGLGNDSQITNEHEVKINLGSEYPRSLPVIQFTTDVLHPNISGGRPCFGTFMMNPNVRLVDLVEMIWDMIRMSTYNPYGGYGDRDQWQILRKELDFPVDKRILRDKVERFEEEDAGEEEPPLVIMGGASLDGMPPSQIWVKAALEQYFESRGFSENVTVFSGDEWYAESGEAVPNLISVVQMDDMLAEAVHTFGEDLDIFTKKLGLNAQVGFQPGVLYLFGRGR